MRSGALFCLVFCAGLTSCDEEDAARDAGADGDPALAAVLARLEGQGWALYRFPRELATDERVVDPFGETLAAVPEAAEMFWADLDPYAMWQHEGRLFLVRSGSGEIVVDAPTRWWPAVGGEGPGDAVRSVPPLEALEWSVVAPRFGMSRQPLTEEQRESQTGCTPRRYAIIVVGAAGDGGEVQFAQHDANALAAKGVLTGRAFGIAEADVREVKPRSVAGGTNVAQVRAAVEGLDLQCCDEVVIYYAGHGVEQRGDDGTATSLHGTLFLGPGDLGVGGLDAGTLATLMAGQNACRWLVILA